MKILPPVAAVLPKPWLKMFMLVPVTALSGSSDEVTRTSCPLAPPALEETSNSGENLTPVGTEENVMAVRLEELRERPLTSVAGEAR